MITTLQKKQLKHEDITSKQQYIAKRNRTNIVL